ncbi:MAG: hypothetical protein ABSG04_07785 [Verrucomicrobiota bacterium]
MQPFNGAQTNLILILIKLQICALVILFPQNLQALGLRGGKEMQETVHCAFDLGFGGDVKISDVSLWNIGNFSSNYYAESILGLPRWIFSVAAGGQNMAEPTNGKTAAQRDDSVPSNIQILIFVVGGFGGLVNL